MNKITDFETQCCFEKPNRWFHPRHSPIFCFRLAELKIKKVLIVLLLGSVTFSCRKNSEYTEHTKHTESPESAAFSNEREAFFNNLMEPAEAAAKLQLTGAEFNRNLMNSPQSYPQYTKNEVKAAANLGVYLSDLNYCIAYKQTADTKEYFTAVHELSIVTGIEKSILEFLTKRYNDNITQNDSVKNIVTDLLAKSTRDLQGTEREKLAGIAMGAYQIENLHLALGILESYPEDMLPDDDRAGNLVPIIKMVIGQRGNVENIYHFLKTYSDPQNPEKNPNYLYYSNAFEELIALYRKLDVEEKIANNQGVELMDDEGVEELSEKVDVIRNKIVSGQE